MSNNLNKISLLEQGGKPQNVHFTIRGVLTPLRNYISYAICA